MLKSGDGHKGNGSRKENDSSELVQHGVHGSLDLLESRRKQDFFIKPKYQNTLPDVPCDPKHLTIPLNPSKFELPSTELSAFYDQLVGWNCAVTVDLVGNTLNPRVTGKEPVELDPRDQLLLEDDDTNKLKDELVKRSKTHKTNVTWLRRPEYISSEPAKFKTLHGEKLEYRIDKAIGRNLKSKSKWTELLNNRKERIKSIDGSFEISAMPITEHPAKPGVYAEEVIPVFPDFDLWKHKFVEIVFDTSPSTSGHLGKINEAQTKNGLLQVMNLDEEEEGVERIGYFVPSSSSLSDNMTDNESHENESTQGKEFSMARDYIFKQGIKNYSTIHDTFIFMEKEGKLTYCDMDKKINLNRSIKTDSRPSLRRAKLMVTYRPPNEKEMQLWNEREQMLYFEAENDNIDCASTVVSGYSAVESNVSLYSDVTK